MFDVALIGNSVRDTVALLTPSACEMLVGTLPWPLGHPAVVLGKLSLTVGVIQVVIVIHGVVMVQTVLGAFLVPQNLVFTST